MPKTTRRPQRRATAATAWSLSSDDEVSLSCSSNPRTTLPRQRHCREQRPLDHSGGRNLLDSTMTTKSSSSSSTKERPSSMSSRRKLVKRDANDDSPSDEKSSNTPKKRPASRSVPTKRPCKTSRSTSRSGKLVMEDIVDTSSNEESSKGHKNPPASRSTASRSLSSHSKNDRRCTLERDQSSSPAFTPIVPNKKKAAETSNTRTPRPPMRTPIRVNLTPDYSRHDMPKGWLAKSQLLDVATKHNGMAIQYRVMYHQSQKPIRDNNAGASRRIRYKEVVVQSRFACTSGSFGGSTYSFMRWKLPGTLLQSRNAKHVTIYEDTRPRLPHNGREETCHPVIIICTELNDADRRMAERFLCNAQAGMTPEQFYSRQHEAAPKSGEVGHEETQEDSPQVSQDEDDGGGKTACGYEAEEEERENRPRTARLSSSVSSKEKRRDEQSHATKARPLRDQNSSTKPSSTSSKRGRDKESDDKTSKRARKKGYGRSRNRGRKKVTFQIGENDSSVPQFLTLVEGVAGAKCGSRSPEDKAEDYIRDVFMNGRVEKLPSTGRMLELPGEAKTGTWTAELMETKDRSTTLPGKGMMRDQVGNLKDTRIQLRHDSAKRIGSLNLSRPSADSPFSHSPSSGLERRIRGGGASLSVSIIDPSHGRRHNLLAQGIVSRETLDDAFIGSISIAGFDGFTSSADARLSAESKSASLLENCRKKAIDMEIQGLGIMGSLEDILPIPVAGRTTIAKDVHNVGISFICKIALEDSSTSYSLLVGHDEDGRIIAVDVVFDEALLENSTSSLSSTDSYREPSRLTEKMLRRHSEDLEQADAACTSSEYSDDGAGMLLDDEFETTTLPGSSPSAKVSFDATKEEEIGDIGSVQPTPEVSFDRTPSIVSTTHAPRTNAAATAVATSEEECVDSSRLKPVMTSNSTSPAVSTKAATCVIAAATAEAASEEACVDTDRFKTVVTSNRRASTSPDIHVSHVDAAATATCDEERVVTINPTPSMLPSSKRAPRAIADAADADAATAIAAPKSILKKQNLIGQVTPAAREANRHHIEASSSDVGVGEPYLTGLVIPFVTPMPGRDKSRGLLPKLAQVADVDKDSVDTANVEYSEDSSDIFEDPLNEDEGRVGGNQIASDSSRTVKKNDSSAVSPVSRWPSVHDVFHGVYDEEEYVECTLEDLEDFSVQTENTTPYFFAKLHELLYGLEDDVDGAVDTPLHSISSRHKIVHGTYFSSVRVMAIIALLWLMNKVPSDKEIPSMTISRVSLNKLSATTFPFASQPSDRGHVLFAEDEQAAISQNWFSSLWYS